LGVEISISTRTFPNLFKLSLAQPICYKQTHTEVPFVCLDGRVVTAS